MPNTTLRIWYAEDDEEDRLIFRDCITKSNERVELKEFEDADALVKYLLTAHNGDLPNAIISDMKMPVLDGAGLLKFMKDHQQFESIPVIIFSTSSSSFDKENCFELGAISFFSKPSSFNEIKLTVYEIISLCKVLAKNRQHQRGQV